MILKQLLNYAGNNKLRVHWYCRCVAAMCGIWPYKRPANMHMQSALPRALPGSSIIIVTNEKIEREIRAGPHHLRG